MCHTKVFQISNLPYVLLISLLSLLLAGCPGKAITKLGGTPVAIKSVNFVGPDSEGMITVFVDSAQGKQVSCRDFIRLLRANEEFYRGSTFSGAADTLRQQIEIVEGNCRAVDAPID